MKEDQIKKELKIIAERIDRIMKNEETVNNTIDRILRTDVQAMVELVLKIEKNGDKESLSPLDIPTTY